MNGDKLAIIGARGVGHHGGFETVVAELAPRLRANGYEVYCSVRTSENDETPSMFEGVKLIRFPLSFPKSYSIGKIFEVFYDSYFVLKSKFYLGCDVTYSLGVASGLSLMITKWFGPPSAVNVDGLEWKRDKFGLLARFFLRASFIACCIGSDVIVLDNRALMVHVPRRFRSKAVCITYGVSPIDCVQHALAHPITPNGQGTALEMRGYWLVVARLEPENNIHTIIKGYLSSNSEMPLVIVGDSSSPRYGQVLSDIARGGSGRKKVIMAGSIYDQSILRPLRCGCLAYIHGHSVGGTNPSLLEAMSASNIVISHDNAFNREVCSDAALFFTDAPTLANAMDEVESEPSRFASLGRDARDRVDRFHQWDVVASDHETLFRRMKSI